MQKPSPHPHSSGTGPPTADNRAGGRKSGTHDAATCLETLLRKRSSCRGFLSKQVPEPVRARLFTMAQRTPSWSNTQPWHVVVTSGAETKRFAEAISEDVTNGPRPDLPFPVYEGVHAERRRAVGHALYSALGIERHDREARSRQLMRNYEFFGAPHVAVVATPKSLGVYGAVDCGAYIATLLLAAQSLGLAAIAQGAVATQSPVVRSFLGIPDDFDIVCGVGFGYADADHPANLLQAPRAPLEESVRFVGE